MWAGTLAWPLMGGAVCCVTLHHPASPRTRGKKPHQASVPSCSAAGRLLLFLRLLLGGTAQLVSPTPVHILFYSHSRTRGYIPTRATY